MQITSHLFSQFSLKHVLLVIVTDPRFNLAQPFQQSVLRAIKLKVYELLYEILSYNNKVKATDSLSVRTTISKPFASLTRASEFYAVDQIQTEIYYMNHCYPDDELFQDFNLNSPR